MKYREVEVRKIGGKLLHIFSLRRGGGRKRSSSENVLAVVEPGKLGCGLLRLNNDGFLIPKRPKMDFCALGVVGAFACGADCITGLFAAPATCNCSLSDM